MISMVITMTTAFEAYFNSIREKKIAVLSATVEDPAALADRLAHVERRLAAAKKNSQTLAQVLQSSTPATEDATLPSAFDADTDFSGMTDEEIEAAAKAEGDTQTQTMSLDRINAAGCIY